MLIPVNPASDQAGFILHEKARRYTWKGTLGLSLKCMLRGRAVYEVAGGPKAVEDGGWLVVNSGQPYSIQIQSERETESLCIFFKEGMAEEVLRTLTKPARCLADQPQTDSGRSVRFFERIRPSDAELGMLIDDLRREIRQSPPPPQLRLEEMLHQILQRMFFIEDRLEKEAERLSALRASTREELYRRLHRARDFMDCCLDRNLTLNAIASTACLSPHHFLRSFRELFGVTPHQHLISRRLESARRLLASTDRPVTEICLDVGFESLGSFSRLFRQRVGVSPQQYRKGEGSSRKGAKAQRTQSEE